VRDGGGKQQNRFDYVNVMCDAHSGAEYRYIVADHIDTGSGIDSGISGESFW